MGPSEVKEQTVAEQWRAVAGQIAAIIRVSGLEVFQQAVRQVARERLRVRDERERREKERRKVLKEIGVLYRPGSPPEQPEEGDEWYLHIGDLVGKIKLPPEIALPPKMPERWSEADKDKKRACWAEWYQAALPFFEYVKQQGFPNVEDGDCEYCLQVCCWLPRELEPADPDDFNPNPANESLLPVPPRALTDAEKMTILAAVYDAHWRGGEKVAPWGVSEDGSEPEAWPADAERDEKRAATDYCRLFQEAQQLDDSDLPVIESWLEELPGSEGSTEEADAAWVPANTLWTQRFDTYKQMAPFRKEHPEMFRNPSPNRLEIHAGLWSTYWAEHDKACSESLDGEPNSIADDPDSQNAFLAGAAERIEAIRGKKRAREAAKKQ